MDEERKTYAEAAGLVSVSKPYMAGELIAWSNDISGLRERLRAAMTARRAQYEDIIEDMFCNGVRKRVPTFVAGLDTGFEEAEKIIDEVFRRDNGTQQDPSI